MKLFHCFILGSALMFSGCGVMFFPSTFTPEQKRSVYNSVQDEIAYRSEQGELHYAQGYYAAAVEDFETLNFYEGRAVIPLSRIKRIAEKGEERSRYYYERGLRVQESDKKQAMIEFNKMMRCNPNYKDGKGRYERLKKEKENQKLLLALEYDLDAKLKKNLQSTGALRALSQSRDALAQYDDSNPSVKKADDILQQQRKMKLEKGIALYNDQKYDDASEKFDTVVQFYPNEPTAQRYLDQISIKQETQKRIKLSRNAMDQKDYRLAMKYAAKALEIDAGNAEARSILESATRKFEQSIPDLIAKGIGYYNKQEMNNALEIFQSVLDADANNSTALVYVKKIKRQLETIKSLK